MKRIIVLLAIFVVIFTNISINTSAATNKYTDGIGVVQVNKKSKKQLLIFYNDGSIKIFKNLSLKKYKEGQAVIVRINTNRTKKLKDDKIIRIQKAYGGLTKIGPTTDKGKRGCLPDDLYFSEVKYET